MKSSSTGEDFATLVGMLERGAAVKIEPMENVEPHIIDMLLDTMQNFHKELDRLLTPQEKLEIQRIRLANWERTNQGS
jgi:hypothetical protein